MQDAVSGVRVIVTGPSQTEEEEDFPPPPPDISGLHIGENVHRRDLSDLSGITLRTIPFQKPIPNFWPT